MVNNYNILIIINVHQNHAIIVNFRLRWNLSFLVWGTEFPEICEIFDINF